MEESDKKNIIIILATLVTSILSLGIFNLFFQLIFLIIFVIICCLGFSYINDSSKQKKRLLILSCTIEAVILCFSIISQGSFNRFCKQIMDFFVKSHEKSIEYVIKDPESYFNEFSSQLKSINEKIDDTNFNEYSSQHKRINEKIDDTNFNIENLDNNVNLITQNLEKIQYNENIDEIESADILQLMKDRFEEHRNQFPNLITDIYSIELFYKAFISENAYYYCNILDAFNKYGINTDKFDITENTLFIWDIEKLYMTYNMKASLANELESDEIFEERFFYYNDYKVKLNRFSDTFDYGTWRRYYTNKTPKQIDELMNKSIMVWYQKFR